MDSIRTPLSISVPIVDPKTGNPTPFFQRIMQVLLEQKATTDALAEGAAPASRLITSGGGLTGGGDLSADRTLAVGAGTGIIVNADDVAADPEYIMDTINSMLVAGTNITLTYNDVANTLTIAASGGSSAWTLFNTTTIGAAVAQVDVTGISANEILIVTRNIVKSISGVTALRLSVDNGATFYSTSGDYILIPTSGVESNQAYACGFHSVGATAARSGVVHIPVAGTTSAGKVINNPNINGEMRLFAASTSPINAIRILNASGGNLTSGTIYTFTR